MAFVADVFHGAALMSVVVDGCDLGNLGLGEMSGQLPLRHCSNESVRRLHSLNVLVQMQRERPFRRAHELSAVFVAEDGVRGVEQPLCPVYRDGKREIVSRRRILNVSKADVMLLEPGMNQR